MRALLLALGMFLVACGGSQAESTTTTAAPTPDDVWLIRIGEPIARTGQSAEDLNLLRDAALTGVDGQEAVAATDQSPAAAVAMAAQSDLIAYALDPAIIRLEEADGMWNAEVTLILSTLPGRDIRATLRGTASLEVTENDAKRRVLEGSVTGALRQLPMALQAADARGF